MPPIPKALAVSQPDSKLATVWQPPTPSEVQDLIRLSGVSQAVIDRQVAGFALAISQSEALTRMAKQNPERLTETLYKVISLNLPLIPALGAVWLVPKAGTILPIVGWKGWQILAQREGWQVDPPQTAYEGDELEYTLGWSPTLYHKPSLSVRGKPTHYYAVARRGDDVRFFVMSHEEMAEHRNRSAMSQGGPWHTHFNRMAEKTVVKRLCERLGLTFESQTPEGIQTLHTMEYDSEAYEVPSLDPQPSPQPAMAYETYDPQGSWDAFQPTLTPQVHFVPQAPFSNESESF